MTKDQLQAELTAKVKPGIKPSHLKRSKSVGELPSNTAAFNKDGAIPTAPPVPSLNNTELTACQAENVALKKRIQALEEKEVFVEAPEENISELKTQIEKLEQQILELRLSKIKEFGDYYQQKQSLESELANQPVAITPQKLTTTNY
ncbi:5798_t:CDS:1 [Ambispora gerdemannii]|uniref:5798_t:CDS:1 n=1 Tax=Ambispora gerdemannii TaxID=144530 RepID=A0A9N9GHF8_9GLOM|nr:5798_t:CDS:1 [Ambispora gerdemannii]